MKLFKKILLTTLITSAVGLGFANSSKADNELVIFSLPNLSSPFEVQMSKTALAAAKKLKLNLNVLDGQSSSTKQVSDLENSIIRGAKGIILAPNDVNAIAGAASDIVKEKIGLVTVDRKVSIAENVPHFGADNYKGGSTIAQFVIDNFPKGANIVLLTGQPGSSSNIERTQGIRDTFKKAGNNYKIVVDQTGNWLRSEGLRIVESIVPTLKQKPDVIVSANDDMALGALEALQSLGYKKGEIKVTGFDAGPEALSRIKSGWLLATADQRPAYAVSSALEQIANYIRHHKPITGLNFAPKIITLKNLSDAERFNEIK